MSIMTESATVLQISTSTSRGRDTYGYTIVRLDDTTTGKRYRCMGGGYDMVGTVFADWLQETQQDRLQAIAGQAYTMVDTRGRHTNGEPSSFYGMTHLAHQQTVSLDGACGLESIRRIADAVGLEVRQLVSKRGRVTGFVVTDTREELAARDAGLGCATSGPRSAALPTARSTAPTAPATPDGPCARRPHRPSPMRSAGSTAQPTNQPEEQT